MSISDGLFSLAEVKVGVVNGVKGVGAHWLQFAVEFRLNATQDYQAVVSDPICFVYAGTDAPDQLLPLGPAFVETAWFAETSSYSRADWVAFRLPISSEQLGALEKLRNGGALNFRLDLHVLVQGKVSPRQRGFEQVRHEVSLSHWLKVLESLGQSEHLILTIGLPTVEDTHPLRDGIAQLREAKKELDMGRYDNVVRRVRLCLDAAEKIAEDQDAQPAYDRFARRETREQMTQRERAAIARAAIRHYTHLAHHTNDFGQMEVFSRDDALFILTAGAAALRDALGAYTIRSTVQGCAGIFPEA